MSSRILQPNFSGGIIGPEMYARSDTTKFAVGVKQADNFMIRLQGGLANRPGFRLASGFSTGSETQAQWLVPFQISDTLSYHLEFGEDEFRVISEGAYVLDSSFTDVGVASITSEATARIECSSSGEAATLSAGDLVYLQDPNGDHTLTEQILRVDSVSSEFVTFSVYDGTTLDTSAGSGTWGTIGAGATLSKIYSMAHPYDLDEIPFARFAQDNLDLYIAHPNHPLRVLTITAADDWALAEHSFEPSVSPPEKPSAAPVTITDITQADPAVVTAAGHGFTDGTTVFIKDVVGMTEVNGNFYVIRDVTTDTFSLESTGGDPVDSTGFTAYSSDGEVDTFVVLEESAQSGVTYRYRISSLREDTLEESLPSTVLEIDSDVSLVDITLAWPAVENAGLYNIYKETTTGFGYIGTTAQTVFTDNNIEPNGATTPKTSRNPFDSTDNYPAVVSFVEQRLALANTVNDPQIVEMSATGAFNSFTRSYPSDADDSLSFRLRTKTLNDVRAMVSGRAMVMFTSSAEWVVTGNENEGVLTPTSIVPRPESYWGSFDIEPLTVGENALFVEPSGNVIRNFLLTLNPNAPETSRDLTVLVRHLFEGRTITSWTYTKSPYRTVWVTLDDGSLLALTYMAEHDIWGWTTHTLGGADATVYQVSAAREGTRDVLYAVVGRTVNSTEVVMTERMDARVDDNVEDAYFLDAGLSYGGGGPAASAVSGLLHLRGENVTALVDGSVVEGLTVNEAGVVDFGDREGEVIHVGLGYEATMETLNVDFETEGLGSMRGRYKAASEVAVVMHRTRGVSAGVTEDALNEIKEWRAGFVGGPIPLFTGTKLITVEGDWLRDASVVIKQEYPLPATILGIAPEWSFGE